MSGKSIRFVIAAVIGSTFNLAAMAGARNNSRPGTAGTIFLGSRPLPGTMLFIR